MKVNIHQREGARVVASELSLAKSILRIIIVIAFLLDTYMGIGMD